MSYQNLEIIGHVGKDAEMRYTPNGQAVTSFTVATNREYTNSEGGKIKETVWFRVSAWGKLAEICNQYVHKGDLIYCDGRLTTDPATGGPRVWTAQDGSARSSFEMTASTVRFLTRGSAEAPEQEPEPIEDETPF